MSAATPAGAAGEPPRDVAAIRIDRVPAETIRIPIIGTSPLIVHKWSEKAKRQMLEAQQGRKAPKGNRDPQEEYEASMYRTEDGYGFPVLGFKAATVGGARFYGKAVKMTELRQFLFFTGVPSRERDALLVPIIGEPKMREDMVRVGMGTDLRYRAEFVEWSAVLTVTYASNALDRGSVLSLVDAGGLGVGIGDWRPEKDGLNGTYAVDDSRDVEVVQR